MIDRNSRNLTFARALTAVAVLLLCAGTAGAYTLVTRDGHRIESQSKPEIKGTQVFVRLSPRGMLAVIQQDKIDWARTQAANPGPMKLTVPRDAQIVQGTAASTPSIEKKITGENARKNAVPNATPEGDKKPDETIAKNPPSSQQSIVDQEALIALQKQHAEVSAMLDTARAEKDAYQKQLDELQSRETSNASNDEAKQAQVRKLQDQISEANGRINQLESRLQDIRAEAAQHGGTID